MQWTDGWQSVFVIVQLILQLGNYFQTTAQMVVHCILSHSLLKHWYLVGVKVTSREVYNSASKTIHLKHNTINLHNNKNRKKQIPHRFTYRVRKDDKHMLKQKNSLHLLINIWETMASFYVIELFMRTCYDVRSGQMQIGQHIHTVWLTPLVYSQDIIIPAISNI